ncbi:MAG: hypothetical protein JO218_13155 [Burkholderiales bacterium]|nr:hypothetical protein [Burkholderiales bacterium]
MADENFYQASVSSTLDVVDMTTQREAAQEFYVVGLRKMAILNIFTLGLYQVYWFYKNWSMHKRFANIDCWPVMRGIFCIFFTHRLYEKVQQTLEQKQIPYRWEASTLATGLVITNIAANLLSRVDTVWTNALGTACIFIITALLYPVQGAINTACGQPNGESNASLTWANYLWIVPGAIMWCFAILGFWIGLRHA